MAPSTRLERSFVISDLCVYASVRAYEGILGDLYLR